MEATARTNVNMRVKAKDFRALINATSIMLDECRMRVEGDRVTIKAVDPAHVAMVTVTLRVPGQDLGTWEVGLACEKLAEWLRKVDVSPEDDLDLTWDQTAPSVTISHNNIATTLRMLDTTGMRDPKLPAIESSVVARVVAKQLAGAMTSASAFADVLRLTAKHGAITMVMEGDVDRVEARLASCDPALNERSLYSIDYFGNMVRALSGISSEMTLEFGTDWPARLWAESETIGIEYIIAPRVES